MRIVTLAAATAIYVVGSIAAGAQTAPLVDPTKINELSDCQSTTIVQVKAYNALAALMRGAKPVAIDDTTGHFLDRTADSVSAYASSRLHDAQVMDGLAARILADGYESYKAGVDALASKRLKLVTDSAFGPLPSSGPTADLAVNTDRCYDVISSILSDLAQAQD